MMVTGGDRKMGFFGLFSNFFQYTHFYIERSSALLDQINKKILRPSPFLRRMGPRSSGVLRLPIVLCKKRTRVVMCVENYISNQDRFQMQKTLLTGVYPLEQILSALSEFSAS